MTGLAPSRSVALAVVVIHVCGSYRRPRRSALVAGAAFHGRAAEQLRFGDMVGGLCSGHDVGPVVTVFAGNEARVVHGF